MNYLTYPFKTMRITQSYTGTTSHQPHTLGSPRDFPIDEGGKDTGKDPLYCPCDKVKIVKIYGVGNRGTNTIWIQSTSPVIFADGTEDYFCAQITHPNDSDLKRLKVGQKFKRGQIICYEGTDGASGNHIHMSIGKGKMSGGGWTKNTRGKWVLTTTHGTIKPENGFIVDETFTKIVNSKGLPFRTLKTIKQQRSETYKVTAKTLNCRQSPTTDAAIMTTYSKGDKLVITQKKTVNGYTWGKCTKGWIALDYCKKVS